MPCARIMSGREYDLHDVWRYQLHANGGVEGYGKNIRRNRQNRETMFQRQVSFAVSMLEAGQTLVEREPKLSKRAEARKARERMVDIESRILIKEFADTVHSQGGIPESAFYLQDPEIFIEDREKNVWDMFLKVQIICRSYFPPPMEFNEMQTCRVVRAMSVMNFCLNRGNMDRIADLVYGKDILKHTLEYRMKEVRANALRVCQNMHIWFRTGALSILLRNINGGRKVAQESSQEVFALLRHFSTYSDIMLRITDQLILAKQQYSPSPVQTIDFKLDWGSTGIMCKKGDFVLMHDAMKSALASIR